MKRHIEVHTTSGARVALDVHQFLAGGTYTEYADSSGIAQFDIDIDSGAEITIYVNGSEVRGRHAPKDEYHF